MKKIITLLLHFLFSMPYIPTYRIFTFLLITTPHKMYYTFRELSHGGSNIFRGVFWHEYHLKSESIKTRHEKVEVKWTKSQKRNHKLTFSTH